MSGPGARGAEPWRSAPRARGRSSTRGPPATSSWPACRRWREAPKGAESLGVDGFQLPSNSWEASGDSTALWTRPVVPRHRLQTAPYAGRGRRSISERQTYRRGRHPGVDVADHPGGERDHLWRRWRVCPAAPLHSAQPADSERILSRHGIDRGGTGCQLGRRLLTRSTAPPQVARAMVMASHLLVVDRSGIRHGRVKFGDRSSAVSGSISCDRAESLLIGRMDRARARSKCTGPPPLGSAFQPNGCIVRN
jgi:hypothetical protein